MCTFVAALWVSYFTVCMNMCHRNFFSAAKMGDVQKGVYYLKRYSCNKLQSGPFFSMITNNIYRNIVAATCKTYSTLCFFILIGIVSVVRNYPSSLALRIEMVDGGFYSKARSRIQVVCMSPSVRDSVDIGRCDDGCRLSFDALLLYPFHLRNGDHSRFVLEQGLFRFPIG